MAETRFIDVDIDVGIQEPPSRREACVDWLHGMREVA